MKRVPALALLAAPGAFQSLGVALRDYDETSLYASRSLPRGRVNRSALPFATTMKHPSTPAPLAATGGRVSFIGRG
jgi:hypothetical protein